MQKVANDTATDDHVAGVLYSSGRSITELESAVTQQRKINHLNELVATLPAVVAEQTVAQAAFSDLRLAQKKITEQMAQDFSAARDRLTTAVCRVQSAKDAENDLYCLSNPHSDLPIPQWNDPYTPDPATAKQMKVEEIVNAQVRAQIRKETGQDPVTGCSFAAFGAQPASGFPLSRP